MEDHSMIDVFDPTADENDRASNAELTHNLDSIERIRALAQPEFHPDFDGRHCVECGEAVPKPRLSLGKVRCLSCQERIEAQAALRGK